MVLWQCHLNILFTFSQFIQLVFNFWCVCKLFFKCFIHTPNVEVWSFTKQIDDPVIKNVVKIFKYFNKISDKMAKDLV